MNRRPRVCFSKAQREAFISLFNKFEKGKFAELFTQNNASTNLVKCMAWSWFTEAFNAGSDEGGYEPLSKAQLQNLHKNIKIRSSKDTSDLAAVNLARKYASQTGGGPVGPDVPAMDGDVLADLNPLNMSGLVPMRDKNSMATSADGRSVFAEANYNIRALPGQRPLPILNLNDDLDSQVDAGLILFDGNVEVSNFLEVEVAESADTGLPEFQPLNASASASTETPRGVSAPGPAVTPGTLLIKLLK